MMYSRRPRAPLPWGFALFLSLWTLSGAGALWFHWLANYEAALFGRIVETATRGVAEDGARVQALLHAAHRLVNPRFEVFRQTPYASPVETLFRSPLLDLADGKGACGSFTAVLARLLHSANYEFRIVQMNCRRASGELVLGCHMFVEARAEDRWMVVDALYDLSFVAPDGGLASLDQVSRDWAYYRRQTPAGFPADWYDYQSFQYTNWDKIPYVLPAIKGLLGMIMGDEVERLSLRSLVIDGYRVLAYEFFVAWLILGLAGAWRRLFGAESARSGV